MAYSSFGNLSLDNFIAEESAPDDLWVFIHIPKTGGSSFASELAELRRPYRNIHVDYNDRDTPHDVKLDRAVDRFIADAGAAPFRSCSGHITMRHFLRIRQDIPKAKAVSILRNPVERVVSDFRYARTPAHPLYKEFIREYPTIESYVDLPANQNKMCTFLAQDRNMGVPEIIAFLDQSIAFIGLIEMHPMSFNIVMQLLGLDRFPRSHERKTETTQFNLVERTAELVQRIKKVNAHDVALFEFVKARMLSRHDQWLASKGLLKARAE